MQKQEEGKKHKRVSLSLSLFFFVGNKHNTKKREWRH